MALFFYSLAVLGLTAGLAVVSYLDRVYRELGYSSTGRIHDHLDAFAAHIEPRFRMDRHRGALVFSLLARLWMVLVAAVTALGVFFFVPGTWEPAVETALLLGAVVVFAMQLLPLVLLAVAPGNWISPLVPTIRLLLWIIWPIHGVIDLLTSILRISEDEPNAPADDQQTIEEFVEAATEEGIIEQDEARLIEQVVEFRDKHVRDVMTPRPDVVAIPASATLEDLRRRIIETKFSRLPVYEKSLDDITGIVIARDMLEVPDHDAARRTVRELMRPVVFIPEMKLGSDLLKEMQRTNQQMAVVIDEHGLMAGVVTVEDLIEEIVGDIGEEDRRPPPDVIREAGGSVVLRGSVPVDKIGDIFGVLLDSSAERPNVATVAGLLNSLAGHVPTTGEIINFDSLRFEVLEANQRKVLRVRARLVESVPAAPSPKV